MPGTERATSAHDDGADWSTLSTARWLVSSELSVRLKRKERSEA